MQQLREVYEFDTRQHASLLTTSAHWSAELPLSPRECEITRLVACDLSNKEVARVLEISEWTVSAHVRRIFGKLQVHSKAAMVACVLDMVVAAERRRVDEAIQRRTRLAPSPVPTVDPVLHREKETSNGDNFRNRSTQA